MKNKQHPLTNQESEAQLIKTLKLFIKTKLNSNLNIELFYKLFLKFFDVRLMPMHNKNNFTDRESLINYIKQYINSTATRLKVDPWQLTSAELNTNWLVQQVDLTTSDSINLKSIFINSWIQNENNRKWVIIVHGLNSHKYRSIFYGLLYLRSGYNIAVMDLRNHGESQRANTTLGFNEKWDVESVVNYLLSTFKPTLIGFHGWSMGTFAIMEYLKLNRASNSITEFTVLDSTVDRISNLWKYMIIDVLKMKNFNHLPDLFNYAQIHYGYNPLLINPGCDLGLLSKIKILYFLNEFDSATPINLGLSAFNNKILTEQDKPISRHVVLPYEHARGIYLAPTLYQEYIDEFIKN